MAKRAWAGYCNGEGHKGGAKSFRVCEGCGERKANTAFRGVDAVCMKCSGSYQLRRTYTETGVYVTEATKVHQYRCSFEVWMEQIGATDTEWAVVMAALRRYGLKGPSADDVLTEYANGVGRPQRHGALFHATVLAANEHKALGTRAGRKARREQSALTDAGCEAA